MKNKRKKILQIAVAVLLTFVVVTFVATFFGVNLPWTAHRASAVMVPEVDYDNYEWFEENGMYISDDPLDDHIDNLWEINDMVEAYVIYKIDLPYGKWIQVAIYEDNFIIGRAFLNFYAKWHNVPIFYYFGQGNGLL